MGSVRSSRRWTTGAALPLLVAGGLVSASAASGATTTIKKVSAADDAQRACHTRPLRASDSVVRFTSRAPGDSIVRATTSGGGGGDWDIAIFDARSRDAIAASAGFRSDEVASGFASKNRRLIVQACRYSGGPSTVNVSLSFHVLPAAPAAGASQLVEVQTPTRADKNRLTRLGLDLTEHGRTRWVEVVLHGRADAAKLRRAGFEYKVKVADLRAQARRNRAADARYDAEEARSDLPSGRTSYRHLWDYEYELKALVAKYPTYVKPLVLNHKTHEGRWVNGIEVTRDVATDDGRPIHLNLGVHHAREWPSSEHSLELAYDLLVNRDGDASAILDDVRTIVVPIVNPDGFNVSREADPGDPAQDFTSFDYEMKRKNCRPVEWAPDAPCQAIPNSPSGQTWGRRSGVDPNRNYGGFWGGPGASVNPRDDTYRGPGPFSEPETQNIHDLHATRNVTTLITNHTYSNLVLRPPGTIDVGTPLDEPLLRDLGARMTSKNAYANIPAYGLYDTTGATEDWTYWTGGSLGYTFEIGDAGFHPPFEDAVVGEYLGRAPAQSAGRGGNRAAYYEMLQATRDTATHSVLTGTAPAGHRLKLSKSFTTSTHDPRWLNDFGTALGEPILFEDGLDLRLASAGGPFEWHVTPSTRPVVAGRLGREPTGPPQANIPLANPEGVPKLNPYDSSYEEGEFETIPFTVQGPEAGVDNGRMTVHIEWTDPEVDWDLYVINAEGAIVAQSAAFGDTTEDAVLLDPPAGEYRAIVVNFDQAGRNETPENWDDWTAGEVRFRSPDPTTIGPKETWMLSCETEDGTAAGSRAVVVDRGQTVDVGEACTPVAK